MIGHARRAEIVGDTTYRYHQVVVTQVPPLQNFSAFATEQRGQLYLLLVPVYCLQFTIAVLVSRVQSVGPILQGVGGHIHNAGSHFV